MQDNELITLWKSYHEKLDASLQMNRKCLEEIQLMKASSALKRLRTYRWIGIIFGVIWLAFIGFLIYHSLEWNKIAFVISAGIHWLVSAYAVVVYIMHLQLLDQFDNSSSIVEAQQTLVILYTSNLRILGILLLQLPVFSTWYMSAEWYQNSPATFLGIQVPIVLLEAWIGWWAFRNLHHRNHNKKWFRWLVRGSEFDAIKRATSILQDAGVAAH